MDDLSTRTVAQLKAQCKERGIRGYAKLAKAGLIEKLTASLTGTKSGAAASVPSTAAESAAPPITIDNGSSSKVVPRTVEYSSAPQPALANAVGQGAVLQTALPSGSSSSWASDLHASLVAPGPVPCDEQGTKRPNESNVAAASKRRKITSSIPNRETTSALEPVFKVPVPPPQPISAAQSRDSSSSSASLPSAKATWPNVSSSFKRLSAPSPARLPVVDDNRDPLPKSSMPFSIAPAPGHPHLKPAAPFKPLRPVVPSSDLALNLNPPAPQLPSYINYPKSTPDVQLDFSVNKFPLIAELTPRPISMPMKLRQRPLARNWAILFTRLSDPERAQVVSTSKAMRYAVYLSASHILRVDFPGARLVSYLRSVRDMEVTDLWPYLRARQAETVKRRVAYDSSFLPHFYTSHGSLSPVSPFLWTSPDNEDQLTVVLRFLAAKAWFSVSLPGSRERVRKWLCATVTDAQEVSKGAVWSVTQRQPSGESETLYILYETCEVISSATSPGPQLDVPVRHDWAQHLAALPTANGRDSLLDLVMWHNGEEYERGISKLWLSHVPADDARRRVAERYVLACVAPNSVSGPYKTARQMADEFSSLRSSTPVQKTPARPSLYLPEHHYVESVSFVAAKPVRRPLHPALAAVQTPGREYIILRDTGMHVGCEEDGVAEVWMRILRCTSHGVAVDTCSYPS